MHLLSAILQRSTNMTSLEFARQNLFTPLGINQVIWPADSQGYNYGWGNIYLYPRDAAKIGYLWLNKGVWDGRQIVSRSWVDDSVNPILKAEDDADYGYGWWVKSGNQPFIYEARGRGGQRISVIPSQNIIVVFTGGGYEPGEAAALLGPSLIDMERPLPPNPDDAEKLRSALLVIREPPISKSPGPLPARADEVSGATYQFEDNPLHVKTITLTFNYTTEASSLITFYDSQPSRSGPLGLDGVYRMAPGKNGLNVGQRGYWNDSDTFTLDYNEIANRDSYILNIHFEVDKMIMSAKESTHESAVRIVGIKQAPQ
jgi:hypothetical protein